MTVTVYISYRAKLHVTLHKTPIYLAELTNKIGDEDIFLINFWDKLCDSRYFDDSNSLIQIKYIKLTNNIYQITVPVKNSEVSIICYVNIS